MIIKPGLKYIYMERILLSTNTEYMFSLSTHGTFTKFNYVPGFKRSLS